jgi:UDPglucose--hexose-1-phosphate uridylyltransferase
MPLNLSEDPHRRYNILTGDWVLVSPHRTKRPWQGKVERTTQQNRVTYDPDCYLCPGNTRVGGKIMPKYEDTFVFTNDFAALHSNGSMDAYKEGLLLAKGEQGICRVVCFSKDHSLTLPDMSIDAICKVIDLWKKEYLELGSKSFINSVQIFENKGAIMGCSNPHPHGQIWAQKNIPGELVKKTKQQLLHWQKTGRSLLSDYLEQELEKQERVICENRNFVALTPFWAIWPYEAMIIPRLHFQHIGQMDGKLKKDFAAILKNLTKRFDNIFDTSFPYSSGIHQSPTDEQEHKEWHFHMAFYPPLLRSATVKKFMVGYEMFGEPQRDITPEIAAKEMREAG